MFRSRTFYLSVSVLCCIGLLFPSIANAHPGRTDSNGGHTCRTNCEKWGLEYGEYHYHNGGGSSPSPDSSSGTNSGSGAGSGSNSESNSNKVESTPKPEPKPQPKIDKKQVQADEHYKSAVDYFDNKKYHDALEELDKIYELDRNIDKTDELVQNSLNAIYISAESKLEDKNYEKSKELLDFILDYHHSDNNIREKADELLKEIVLIEKVNSLISSAETAKGKKEFEKAISYIYDANKLKETKKISKVYDSIMNDIKDEAEEVYLKNNFEKANNLYILLEKHTNSSELKDEFHEIIDRIEDMLLVQEKFELESNDLGGNSLFTLLGKEESKTLYDINIINEIKTYLTANDEGIQFIYNIDIKEILIGGQINES